MYPAQLAKRALVSVLLGLARIYNLDSNLTRDSPDADVKKAFRKVILKLSLRVGPNTIRKSTPPGRKFLGN
jgi:hypothetical protein